MSRARSWQTDCPFFFFYSFRCWFLSMSGSTAHMYNDLYFLCRHTAKRFREDPFWSSNRRNIEGFYCPRTLHQSLKALSLFYWTHFFEMMMRGELLCLPCFNLTDLFGNYLVRRTAFEILTRGKGKLFVLFR